MRSATLLRLCLCTAVSFFGSRCGSGDTNVVINVKGTPQKATTLSVKATLEGRPAMNTVDLSPPASRFGFSLPNSLKGRLTLDAVAMDGDGCTRGSGNSTVTLPMGLTEVDLKMSAPASRTCGTLTPCLTGLLCPFPTWPQSNAIVNLWANSPSDIWAVADTGYLLHYDGKTWTATKSSQHNLTAVWGSGTGDVWVVGDAGVILHYDGMNWQPVTPTFPQTNVNLHGIWGLGALHVYIVGDLLNGSPAFWHWDRARAVWESIPMPSTGATVPLIGVWAKAADDIFACGYGGVILRSTGISTTSMVTNTAFDLSAIWGNANGKVVAVGSAGTILTYDGVNPWQVVTPPTSYNLHAVFGEKDGNVVYVVGATGAFLRSVSPFTTFESYVDGTVKDNLYGVQPTDMGIGWVVGNGGFLGYFDTRSSN